MSTTTNDNRYLEAGWINTGLYFDDSASPLVVSIGGRGTGKTYGILSNLLDRGEFFLILRRTQTILDSLLSPILNPFADINEDRETHIIPARVKDNKYLLAWYHGEKDEKTGEYRPAGAPICLGAALNTFAGIRGLSGRSIKTVFFDEIIPEPSERRTIKDEEGAILNLYESLNRNRELLGDPPMRLIMATNSNQFKSRVLNAFGLLDDAEIMLRKRQGRRRVKRGAFTADLYNYWDSPVSERKRDTFLYQASANKTFNRMSLENVFPDDDFEGVESRPLKEYQPIVSIGELTVYEHRSKPEYYVIPGIKSELRYTMMTNSKIAFRSDFVRLYEALIDGRLVYSTVKVKMEFEEIWRAK